jgi:cysteinyl-tRNA synthetase
LKDIFAKFHPMAVRLFLLGTHYRGPVNFTDEQLKASEEALARLQNTVKDIDFYLSTPGHQATSTPVKSQEYQDRFVAAMDDDFNTAQALAVIFDLATRAHKIMHDKTGEDLAAVKSMLLKLSGVLGLTLITEEKVDDEALALCKERDEARKNKDYKKSDEIRNQLITRGYTVKDTPQGTMISK